MRSLEETIALASKTADRVIMTPQLMPMYNKVLSDIAKNYEITKNEVIKMVHDYRINNSFYKGLEDDG